MPFVRYLLLAVTLSVSPLSRMAAVAWVVSACWIAWVDESSAQSARWRACAAESGRLEAALKASGDCSLLAEYETNSGKCRSICAADGPCTLPSAKFLADHHAKLLSYCRDPKPTAAQPQPTSCAGQSQNPSSDITGTKDGADTPQKVVRPSDLKSVGYCNDAAKLLETARRSPQRHDKPAQDQFKQAAAAFKLAGDLNAANAALAEAESAVRAKANLDRAALLLSPAEGMERGAMADRTCARLDGLEQAAAWYKDAMKAFVEAGASDMVKQTSEKIALIEKYLKDNQPKCRATVATVPPGKPPTAAPPPDKPDNKCAGALESVKAVLRAGGNTAPLVLAWVQQGCEAGAMVRQITADCLRTNMDATIDDAEKKRHMQEIGCPPNMTTMRE